MLCEKCGTQLDKTSKFCTNCGNPVKKKSDFWERFQEDAKKLNEISQQRKEERKQKTTIKYTMILNNVNNSRKKVGSSFIRGGIGGAVGGVINPVIGVAGVASGAMSGKNKIASSTTFLIEYVDGHRDTKTVKNNSSEYKKLVKYLKA